MQVLNDEEVTKTVRRKRAEGLMCMGRVYHEIAESLLQTYAQTSKDEVPIFSEYTLHHTQTCSHLV